MDTKDDLREAIRAKVDLVSFIGDQITLKKQHGRAIGLCPFHPDKSPSLVVYKDHYHCFACQAHGDIFSFVQNRQGLSFPDTLNYLADKLNIERQDESPALSKTKKLQAIKSAILKEAQDIFHKNLYLNDSAHVRSYLIGRGFTEEQWPLFGFGYALPGNCLFPILKRHPLCAAYAPKQLISLLTEVSLINPLKTQDFFSDRLMIPVKDQMGRVIAFGGRALSKDQIPKYKNSRFDKAKALYMLDLARSEFRNSHRAIIVEGYMDALTMYHFGFKETVACLGTALTHEQVKLINGVVPEVILLFDGDEAGQKATLRSIDIALGYPNVKMRVARLPQGYDPDSFLRQYGPNDLQRLIEGAIDLTEYAISDVLTSHTGLALPLAVKEKCLPWLSASKDPFQKSYLIHTIKEKTGIDLNQIPQTLPPPKPTSNPKDEPIVPLAEMGIQELPPLLGADFELMAHLYFSHKQELDASIIAFISSEWRLDRGWHDLAQTWAKEDTRSIPQDSQLERFVDQLTKRSQAFTASQRTEKMKMLIAILRKQRLKATLNQIRIHLASLKPHSQEWEAVLKDTLLLTKEMNEIDGALKRGVIF